MNASTALDGRAPLLRRALAFAGALLLLALAAAGCGGSGDEAPSTAQSKDDFAAAASGICSRTDDEISAAAAKFKAGVSGDVLEFFTDVTLPKLERQYEEIAALAPPEGQADAVDSFVAAGRKAVERSKQDPKLLAVPTGQPTPFDEANRRAGELGLDQCGGG